MLGADGEPVVRWELDDPIDRAVAARAHVELARLHRARGAREIFTFHWDDPRWREGDDFDAYVARLEAAPYERTAYSAHQMGSCRLGADPATSVADGPGRAARRAGRLDRRRLRAADGARRQPDADDHGARAAHRTRDPRLSRAEGRWPNPVCCHLLPGRGRRLDQRRSSFADHERRRGLARTARSRCRPSPTRSRASVESGSWASR